MRAKISKEQAQQIINEYVDGLSSSEIAIKYNVAVSVVKDIVRGRTFVYLSRPDNIREIIDAHLATSRFQTGIASHAKIDKEDAQRIVDRFANGDSYLQIAEDYGLKKSHIWEIIVGESWPDLVRPVQVFDRVRENKLTFRFQTGWADEKHASYKQLTDVQQDILIGSLLGDGSISNKYHGQNCCFVKSQCLKFKEYVDWHYEQLLPYSTSVKECYTKKEIVGYDSRGIILERKSIEKRHNAWKIRTTNHPVFTEMRDKWYPYGIKIVPNDIVLTPLSIAIWYCDDGSNNFADRRAYIFTQGFTFEDVDVLRMQLGKFDIAPTVITKISPYTGKKQPVLSFTSTAYDNLIHLVNPFVSCKCFQYKVNWRPAIKPFNRKNAVVSKDIIVQAISLKEQGASWPDVAKQFGLKTETLRQACVGDRCLTLDVSRLSKRTLDRRCKLDKVQVCEMRLLKSQGWKSTELAKKFNVSNALVSRIVTGKNWKGG